MMDYEVLKTETGYVMQVNGKFYVVPDKSRHLSKHKLMARHEQGEFRAVPEKPVAA